MKLGIRKVWPIIIMLILLFLIYNTKKEYYKNQIEFFDKNLNGIILNIEEGRGTKVFLEQADFFYLEQIKDKSIKVGDSISKIETELSIYRKNDTGKFVFLKKETVLKPKNSYFEFFFGLN